MKKLVRRIVNRIKITLFGHPHMKAVAYNELYLPPFRENQGLSNNETYIQSAIDQIVHLSQHYQFNKDSVVLDFGCGQARLVNGFKTLGTNLGAYYGIDTHLKSINWCKKWISPYGSEFNFGHVAAHNARYNKTAEKLLPLPFDSNKFDLIFLNSVFSHMMTDDVSYYLNEFERTMKNESTLYVTAFVEEDVPDVEDNPDNYLGEAKGTLHRVRFEKKFFLGLFERAGFNVEVFSHQHITRTKQSVIIAKKMVKP